MKPSRFPNVAGFWPIYNSSNLIEVHGDSLWRQLSEKWLGQKERYTSWDWRISFSFSKQHKPARDGPMLLRRFTVDEDIVKVYDYKFSYKQ